MADSNYTRIYLREEFASLVGNIPITLLAAQLTALPLTVPIMDVRFTRQQHAVIIEWSDFPSAQDIVDLDAAVAAFAGGATTSSPFEYNSFAISTSASGTPVTKLNNTTPPLDAGTYQVLWTSSLRMQAVAANTGVEGKVRLTRSDGAFVEQDDAWNLANRHAFNGAITFQVLAGQTITSLLTFSRLGASGTAEMSGARITVDKIS
jgi:hypothetical protein